nr:hypothetical protein [uncultured Anaerosporobacter sp.]
MQEAESIEKFLAEINDKYKKDRVIIIVFARYGISCVNFMLNESFDYLDKNSGEDIDIHMPGYGKYKYERSHLCKGEELIELDNNKLGWFFNLTKFITFKKEIEKKCGWRYNDHMQMVIFNYIAGKINFDDYIGLDFEELVAKGHITNEREALESIIRQCAKGATDIASLKDEYPEIFHDSMNNKMNSMQAAKDILENFRHWIEYNGGNKTIMMAEEKCREKIFQNLIHLSAKSYIETNKLDFSCEPNEGRGPVDFKVSNGSDRTVIEVKLSSNSQYLHGLKVQLEEYALAEKTTNKIYVFVDLGNPRRLKKIQDEHKKMINRQENPTELFIIDAVEKMSASVYK